MDGQSVSSVTMGPSRGANCADFYVMIRSEAHLSVNGIFVFHTQMCAVVQVFLYCSPQLCFDSRQVCIVILNFHVVSVVFI